MRRQDYTEISRQMLIGSDSAFRMSLSSLTTVQLMQQFKQHGIAFDAVLRASGAKYQMAFLPQRRGYPRLSGRNLNNSIRWTKGHLLKAAWRGLCPYKKRSRKYLPGSTIP